MKTEVTKQVIAAIVRWLIAFVGLRLVGAGIIDSQTADAWGNEVAIIVVGLVVLAIPVIWKVLNARFNILALVKAVQTEPPADTPKEIQKAVDEAKAEAKADPQLTVSV